MAASKRIQMSYDERDQAFVSLVREPGDMEHRFQMDTRVWQELGEPAHIQVTVTPRDARVSAELDKDWS